MSKLSTVGAKPFLKWAGGKTQLLPAISARFPFNANDKFIYIEPFTGSGAVLFWVLNHFPNLEKVIINDANADLINLYRVIKTNVDSLIEKLCQWQTDYHNLESSPEKKSLYYYQKRTLFNERNADEVTQAALLVFLNRTCFNGLYRVNAANRFNVPMGRYKNPLICDIQNLKIVHKALEKVELLNTDFENTLIESSRPCFYYFDPPYKPLNKTSVFNTYTHLSFNDDEQVRLKNFCDTLHKKGYLWMLSNSDVREQQPENLFFDELYKTYDIERIQARRNINSNSSKRGQLNELLITNYKT